MTAKIRISLTFITFRRMTISGSERPMTDIMNASAVPIAMPFAVSTCMIGIMPAAFEYSGMPISTAIGTASGLFGPAMLTRKSAGAYP